ncbi:hypothetical protein NC796_11520 [Aliifodinibius sp. S!AR15-10]|uniref:hypothetical protein n=1 Tax=Aliifodinibius sp. S!AR15-10 TaxID=2950437 RepID=UPI002864A9EE|nr:hypothetical protein [Aliifodinibius sp. S!AR15-10]MDR8391776.1 hypothetical protein [Aliifodinibius sp. S!AR15-10]
MKRTLFLSLAVVIVAGLAFTAGFTSSSEINEYTANFETGTPGHMSIGELAFGPEGILFYGDGPGASIYALDTEDKQGSLSSDAININDIHGKIAQKLGAGPDDISIQDMAVNPFSHKVYISLRRGQGNNASYHLLTVSNESTIEEVGLSNVRFSQFELNNVPSPEATDRRGNSLRSASITDLSYADGQVYVAGISNEEFASGFRQIAFPFKGKESLSTLEIYHVSHGQYETNAPIRTFLPYSMDGSSYIVAGYTCTPLVLFSADDLKDGQHVRGKTVAELGNRNRPLDIISYTDTNGNESLMIANSSYSVMRVSPADIKRQSHLDKPLNDGEKTSGVTFESLEYENVRHMDNLNGKYVVMLQQMDDGTIDLRSISK